MAELLNPANYYFNPHAIPPFLVGLLLIGVGLFAVIRNRRSMPSLVFGLLLLSGAVWLISYAGLFSSSNDSTAFLWAKIEHVGVIFLPALLFLFPAVLVGYGRRFAIFFWIVFSLCCLFLFSLFFTPYFIEGVYKYSWGYFASYGPLIYSFVVFIAIIIWTNLVLHWIGYQRSSLDAPRRMFRRFFIAFGIAQLGMMDFLPGFGVPIYPVGSIAVLICVSILAETVFRFQLTAITLTFAAEHILHAMVDALIVFDHAGIIQIANQATCNLLERERSHLIGTPITQALKDPLFEAKSLEEVAERSGITGYEINFPRQNQRVPLSLALSVMRDTRGKVLGYVLIGRDITARKIAEEAIHKAHDELELRVAERTEELRVANEKLKKRDQVKSDFIMMASHELRTPLSAVKGYLSLLTQEKTGTLNETQIEFLTHIQFATDRLHRMLSDLLSISRMETGQLQLRFESVPIREVIAEEIKIFQPMAEKKEITLEFLEENELGTVPCDRDRITQVIENLISNAIKYTLRKGQVKIFGRRFKGNVEIFFSDTGVGIPTGELDKIFEPFYRLQKTGSEGEESTGLGLALVKKIVELHHGQISVESKPAFGSTFKLVLPTLI